MKFSKILVVLAISASAFSSCKDKAVETRTKTELMAGTSSKSWKITKAEASNSGLKLDLVTTQQACITDNILTFNSNGTYVIKEGATKCNAGDPDLMLTANWTFMENETKFKIDRIVFLGIELKDIVFEIVELSDNVFTGKTTIPYNGANYQLEATFQVVK